MTENRKSHRLLNLKHMVKHEVDGERMERWAEAFEDWMEDRRRRFSRKVAQRSYLAWREFLAFTGKAPWETRIEDVEAHVAELEKRGLRAGTITNRLAGLSKFYQYCQIEEIDPGCETGFNPAKQARHPKVVKYERANYLSQAEEAALLEAIRRDPSAMGKRDYALMLMLLRTGWRAGEVRGLRWRELCRGEGIGDKGRGDRGGGVLPEEVGEAVREYLEATGRWEGIGEDDYVFVPSEAPLQREAGERAEDWAGSRPISEDELRYLVKLHAERARLKADKITTRTLRHTAVMRRVEAGVPAESLRAVLGIERLRSVKAYMAWLAHRPEGRLRRRKKASDAEGTPSRGPCRTKPGNHLALQHGLTAKYLPEFEWLAEQGVRLPLIDWVILRYRVVMRRAMLVGRDVRTLEEAMRILKVMGIAACRLVKAVKLKQKMGGEEISIEPQPGVFRTFRR